jgi:hypothetical protein
MGIREEAETGKHFSHLPFSVVLVKLMVQICTCGRVHTSSWAFALKFSHPQPPTQKLEDVLYIGLFYNVLMHCLNSFCVQ